tara:strand:+ start:265 stop:810 length:546 start_codon:yes stop_codon:yes gene_type:complete
VGKFKVDCERIISSLAWDQKTKGPNKYWENHMKYDDIDMKGWIKRIGDAMCDSVGGLMWDLQYTPPGSITHPHADSCSLFAKRMFEWEKVKEGIIDVHKRYVRYWVPLNDRQFGQWFEAEGVKTLCDWRAGDIFISPSAYRHTTATTGDVGRYLMKIAAVRNSNTLAGRDEFETYDLRHVQ